MLTRHLVPKIMHQNLAIILWQFCNSKNSFIVLTPGQRVKIYRPLWNRAAEAGGRRMASWEFRLFSIEIPV